MIQPPCHLAIRSWTDRGTMLARLCAAISFVGLLIAAPVFPQSSSSTSPPSAAAAQATPPSTPAPQPDKGRARKAFEAGRRAEQSGDWRTEYAAFSDAATYDPSNREYRILKEHARFQVVQSLVDSAERLAIAGNIPGAREQLTQALKVDPNYIVARERLAELTPSPAETEAPKGPRLAGLPRLILTPGTQAFDFRGTTRGAYEAIGKQFGVKMVFDGDLPDRAVRFQVPALDFDTAVMVLARQTRTFTRVVDAHTMFVTDDSPQKVREYALEVEKQLLLPASVSTEEMNEEVRMIREMTGIARTQLNTATRTLTVRSTEQNVALAQALLRQIEQPRGELMLDIEILELDRTLANQLGISPPTSSSVFALTLPEIQQLQTAQNNGTLIQILQSIFGSSAVSSATGSALPALIAFGGGKTIFLATMPSVTANFASAISTVHSAQRILLRAQDGKPATFFVGDRYPIDLGLLSSDLNSTSTALSQALGQALLAGVTLPRTDYSTGLNSGPSALALAVFNNTGGHEDIAVANQANSTVSILPGNGDGTFSGVPSSCAAPSSFCIPIPGVTVGTVTTAATPSAIAVGDFNNDGNMDIAVTDLANSRVLILLGNGDGSFQAPVAYATGSNPVALVAQDFDGDGQPDLAVVNQGDKTAPSTVSILLGNKTGGKQDGTFAAKVDYPVGVDPTAITTADFNGDGSVDLAVANHATGSGGDGTVSVLLGKGDGTFGAQSTFSTGNGPAGIATADFNGDGHADLAVANQSDSTVSILLNKGDGTSTFFAHTDFTTGSGPAGIIAANFTGTNTDLAVADETAPNVDVLIGNGDGTFTSPISLPTGNSPVAVAGADLNGDGTIDLVTANNGSSSVTVTLNTLLPSSNLSSGQTAYPSAEYEDLGLKVKATPRLHADNEVTLQLQFDIKSLTGSSINGIPILSNRQIEQTIRLRENETSILSGILQSSQIGSTSGLPWTSTVPGIGLLTGEDTTNIQRSELLILVTPRALRLPPHDVPAVYAGRGEPTTPPAPPQAPPPGPVGAPNPIQPPQGGRVPFGPGIQPGQTPGNVAQPQQQQPQQYPQQQPPPQPQ
ncbi:MAG TPA: FG-GAP-like repeat-containing protein [Candidatus Acidoferrum sp.]|nr:FG-GAP-like repeat-containing protein [Candidatus Acidoferrum sp.]